MKITANGPVLGSFHRMLLPKSKQRLIACVVLADQNYLLCADKMGSLYVYHLSTSDSTVRAMFHVTRRIIELYSYNCVYNGVSQCLEYKFAGASCGNISQDAW